MMQSFALSKGGASSSSYEPVSLDANTSNDNNNEGLQESLVAPAPSKVDAVAAACYVQVTAPANLPEGYQFEAVVNQQKLQVTVPPGGVEAGQKFEVPFEIQQNAINAAASVNIPVGHWRDGLCECYRYGWCHTHIWTSLCCSALAAAQVISRLQFTWRGTPSHSAAASARAFRIVLYITIFHFAMFGILYISILALDPVVRSDDPSAAEPQPVGGMLLFIVTMFDIFKYMYMAVTVALLFNVRRSIRAKYGIPGDNGTDCCLSFWCPCLVAGQLLRHTTEYDVYPSRMCTETGLPDSVPVIV